MEACLVRLDEIKLVAIKIVGRRSELSHRVPPAWLELVRRSDEIPDKVDSNMFYGVFPESDQVQGGQSGVFTYWVGTEVKVFGRVPSGMCTLTVPGQTYAMATVRGGAEQIDPTYIGLGRWIGDRGHGTNPESFGFERYDTRRQPVTPPYEHFDYDIFKPLL